MSEGPEVGLAMLDDLGADLDGYHLRHAARPTCCGARVDATRPSSSTSTRSRSPAPRPSAWYLERRLREVRSSG